MTRYLSSISRAILGPGHAMEDRDPTPVPHRATPVVGSQPVEPAEDPDKGPISDDAGAQEFINLLQE